MSNYNERIEKKMVLSHLPQKPTIDIEFRNLTYSMPTGNKERKRILKSVSGQFKAGQLHAILGPSGAGKSTLLNILAGYKLMDFGGDILINNERRNLKEFNRISRYIMQEDMLQQMLTVQELMEMAAELKLGREMEKENRLTTITEILQLLRISKQKDTMTNLLSGGEKKRLSIALELLNNPPVLFLDEPTTGLDDLASAQCIALLKQLAEGGRTIICSIHTPSAKIFSTFDNVYVLSDGQCTYQGYGPDVVTFLGNIGLSCPTHYNPADYVIEVCSGEYGDFTNEMLNASKNGKNFLIYNTNLRVERLNGNISEQSLKLLKDNITCDGSLSNSSIMEYRYDCSYWNQFRILLKKMLIQMIRDKTYLLMRIFLITFIGIVIGGTFYNFGHDGSKSLYNFGFFYTCIIKFMYIPMMPILCWFPNEIRILKREHLNRWYALLPYFCALTVATLPMTFILGAIYCAAVYIMTDQPLDLDRICLFYFICMFVALVSESMGYIVGSHLNTTNSNFAGPVIAVPIMLMAVYGMGYGPTMELPLLIRVVMHLDFLRYGIHGLVSTVLSNRGTLPCPPEELVCKFADMDNFMRFLKMDEGSHWVDLGALVVMYIVFRVVAFYMLKQRLGERVWWKKWIMSCSRNMS